MNLRLTLQAYRVPPDLPLGLMDVAIGLTFLLGPQPPSYAPAVSIARTLLGWTGAPLRAWGLIFLLLGGLIMVVLRWPRYHLVSVIRIIGPALYVMWAGMYGIAAYYHPVTLAGLPSYAYLAYRHSIAPAMVIERDGCARR